MTTYASNKDGNSIMVDAQEWEELQALVRRQRVIIEMYNEASKEYFKFKSSWDAFLTTAYAAAQDTSTMTGASER